MASATTSGLRRWAAAAIAAGLVSATIAAAPAVSAAPDDDNSGLHPAIPGSTKSGYSAVVDDSKFAGPLADKDSGTVRAFIQFAGTAAGATAKAQAPKGRSAAKAAVKSKRQAIARTESTVLSALKSADSKVGVARRGADAKATKLFSTRNAIPGVAVSADIKSLKEIAARSDVVKISQLVPKEVDNSGAAVFTKVLNTWQDLGLLGDDVSVGIIDTGVDYTHADFGGEGTVEAFDAANENQSTWEPTAKVVGGYDFAGDDYNADPTSDAYQPIPEPDPNPLDCYGHGTHVAGTVGGYGVNADGSTFTGDYSDLTAEDLDAMKGGPGMAPQSDLYALRVFGCDGSTDLVSAALDWSLDPDGDGDFSDHLDVVNLSLGSDFGVEEDPENAMIDALAEYGVLPVIAMGNAGDVTDAGGSPGNAIRSLAVASTLDPFQLMDGLKVDAPADVAGIAPGQNSVAYDWAGSEPVTGDVVAIPGANADGCQALSPEDAAKVAGKVAWLEWDDNDATRKCGSVGRSTNVAAAGAIGAVFTSQLNAFTAGISGSEDIPVFQVNQVQTDKLRPALDDGTLTVTFDGSLAASIHDTNPDIGDTVSSFSSRGTHGAVNNVKPDVAAPGSTIASANVGTGTGFFSNSGTSMATPHVAGISALVKQQHPNWTTEQLKAAIMNTAGHDVYTETGQTGDIYGPARVGAGRVDALDAVSTDVIAYGTGNTGGVSASFGVVWAKAQSKKVTKRQTIKVENTGRTGAKLKVSYDPVISSPGVTYSVSPSSVYVPPRGSAEVTVTLEATTAELAHSIDPTMDVTTLNGFTGLDEPRQYVSDASGRVLLKQVGKADLRVPVYGAVKPYSTTKAKKGRYAGKPAITLRGGQGVSGDITSMVSVMQLGATSAKKPNCVVQVTSFCNSSDYDKSNDIQYVGVGSAPDGDSYANGFFWFGVSTYADWPTVGHLSIPYVDWDTDGDGTYDYEVIAQAVPDAQGYDTDLINAITVDLASGDVVGIAPVNFNYGDVDSNVFDSNTVLLPVPPAAVGITDETDSYDITFRAAIHSGYTGQDVDSVVGRAIDVVNPKIGVSSPIYVDERNAAIPYTLSADATKNDKALVFHLNGRPGDRAETVAVK